MTTAYLVLGGSIAAIPTAIGATALWHRIVDFHDANTDRPSTLPIRPTRKPIAAITAHPHFEAVDELGPWNPSEHQLEPARLFDTDRYHALIGVAA